MLQVLLGRGQSCPTCGRRSTPGRPGTHWRPEKNWRRNLYRCLVCGTRIEVGMLRDEVVSGPDEFYRIFGEGS